MNYSPRTRIVPIRARKLKKQELHPALYSTVAGAVMSASGDEKLMGVEREGEAARLDHPEPL